MPDVALDLNDPQQPYQQVAAKLRAAIISGELAIGEQLKSVRELAHEYGVSNGTVQQALRLLRDAGLITTWQGRGSYVRHAEDTPDSDADATKIAEQLNVILDRLEHLEQQVKALEVERRPGAKRPHGR